jgi:hypothetical protein
MHLAGAVGEFGQWLAFLFLLREIARRFKASGVVQMVHSLFFLNGAMFIFGLLLIPLIGIGATILAPIACSLVVIHQT